jgi:5-(carboxyamino)imidazole ribonucleotide synthase
MILKLLKMWLISVLHRPIKSQATIFLVKYNEAIMDKTIGIFGGGQLGRMMAQAALPLNIQCTFLKPNRLSSSARSGFSSQAEHGLSAFIQSADVFSLEFENTPLEDVDALTKPNQFIRHVRLSRLRKIAFGKDLFDQLDIPVAPYKAVDSLDSLKQAVSELGLPIVLKTATGGYDGKGQFVLRQEDQIEQAWAELGPAQSLIAESFVTFSREVSIIAVRGQNGEVKTWHWLKIIIIMVFYRIRLCLHRTAQIYNLLHRITSLVC